MVRTELFCIFIFLLLAQICADTLYLKSAKRSGGKKVANVTIVKDGYQEIIYKDNNGRRISAEPENVDWIEYSGGYFDFNDGVKAINRGSYGDAIFFLRRSLKILEQIQSEQAKRIYAQNLYYLGRAYQLLAENSALDKRKYQNIIKYYQKAIDTDNAMRFLRECHFYSAQCYLTLKEYDQAQESLRRLKNEISDKKGQTWAFLAYMWQGNIAVQQKDYGNAISEYNQAKNIGIGNQKNKAKLASGHCYIEQQKFAKAAEIFKTMNSTSGLDIRAAAKNGLASCYLAQGKYRKARRTAIEVVLKYQGAQQRQPEALFLLATCYQKLDGQEQGSLQRARTYYRLLQLGYPSSQWARKAIAQLAKLAHK